MTALRRNRVGIWVAVAAALMLALAVPAPAQNSDAPIDVTAAPPPSAGDVGPSQLRNFNLNGTVTRPADRAATTQPDATQRPPAPRAITPATRIPDGAVATSRSSTSRRAATGSEPALPSPTLSLPTLGEPLEGTGAVAALPMDMEPPAAPVGEAHDRSGAFPWPWVAAVLALLAGGAYLMRGRRRRASRYGDFDRLAFAGSPEAPRAAPKPMPRGMGTPQPTPTPTPPRKPVADDGGIVAARLRPELSVEFVPDRAVVTEREVMLQFDLTIVNSGSAPARDVLVESHLVTAHAAQDAEIAGFFAAPAGNGDRMAMIPPLGRVALKSAVRLPLDQLNSFEVEGRRLFVPLVALNLFFRSGAGDGQASASYLVGRGGNDDDKLAPFRLDLGPRIFRGLSARPHSAGLQR